MQKTIYQDIVINNIKQKTTSKNVHSIIFFIYFPSFPPGVVFFLLAMNFRRARRASTSEPYSLTWWMSLAMDFLAVQQGMICFCFQEISIIQVLPSDPLGGLKWPFSGVKSPPFGWSKGHLEEAGLLIYVILLIVMIIGGVYQFIWFCIYIYICNWDCDDYVKNRSLCAFHWSEIQQGSFWGIQVGEIWRNISHIFSEWGKYPVKPDTSQKSLSIKHSSGILSIP